MRLKKHREDVKDLRLMQDAHVQAIAERYRNLYLLAEEADSLFYRGFPTDRMKRVLKDGEWK